MTQNETQAVTDVTGQPLKEGDIIFRTKHSSLTIHRIERFTVNSLVLSCLKTTSTGWRGRQYTQVEDTHSLEDLARHKDIFYFPKAYTKFSIIKHYQFQ